MADSVRTEFLHAWNGYKRYAWGHDALKPLSRTPHDWYGVSLYMTPVDAFDTMVLMGLTDEAAGAKKLILDSLTFDLDLEVQSFEITIRLLGGLLSAYQLDGDRRFLSLAEDLGARLLPVFSSPTGMPYRYVNLRTGRIRDSINNPAEIGTSLLEFGTLSKLTGKNIYYESSKKALRGLYARRAPIGLVGTWINVETGEWVNPTSHIGGAIDSYYEYLVKSWLLFGDRECREMWETHIGPINRYLADTSAGGLWYGQADMNTGARTGTRFGALEAFFPAVLILGGDTARAARLEESVFRMWNLYGIEPEEIDYQMMEVTSPQYVLRPEAIESAYYLYRATGNPRYREMAEVFFAGLKKSCRTESGYAHLQSVVTGEKTDAMESFFFAETLKYLYLIFAPDSVLPFGSAVFMTEAHPVRRTW
ncbi:MAG TPA: glycoside hydrolase family 47 protein [Bacteroidota bacterium]|nr:glycoside hydrolase family 47 protein [Bacteroidota bacterium]